MMFSLDACRCVGDIGKTNVNISKMIVWDIGKSNVFEAVASGGAGGLVLTMNVAQRK